MIAGAAEPVIIYGPEGSFLARGQAARSVYSNDHGVSREGRECVAHMPQLYEKKMYWDRTTGHCHTRIWETSQAEKLYEEEYVRVMAYSSRRRALKLSDVAIDRKGQRH